MLVQSSLPRRMTPCSRTPTRRSLPGSRSVVPSSSLRYPVLKLFVRHDQSFIILEILLQVPVFVVGMRGLWKSASRLPAPSSLPARSSRSHRLADTPTIYPLLLLYSSSSATTTLACLATVLSLPSIPPAHMTKLLASYTPFFLVPAVMAVDMLGRLSGLVRRAEKGKGKAD